MRSRLADDDGVSTCALTLAAPPRFAPPSSVARAQTPQQSHAKRLHRVCIAYYEYDAYFYEGFPSSAFSKHPVAVDNHFIQCIYSNTFRNYLTATAFAVTMSAFANSLTITVPREYG